jgi:hypothetical protein
LSSDEGVHDVATPASVCVPRAARAVGHAESSWLTASWMRRSIPPSIGHQSPCVEEALDSSCPSSAVLHRRSVVSRDCPATDSHWPDRTDRQQTDGCTPRSLESLSVARVLGRRLSLLSDELISGRWATVRRPMTSAAAEPGPSYRTRFRDSCFFLPRSGAQFHPHLLHPRVHGMLAIEQHHSPCGWRAMCPSRG